MFENLPFGHRKYPQKAVRVKNSCYSDRLLAGELPPSFDAAVRHVAFEQRKTKGSAPCNFAQFAYLPHPCALALPVPEARSDVAKMPELCSRDAHVSISIPKKFSCRARKPSAVPIDPAGQRRGATKPWSTVTGAGCLGGPGRKPRGNLSPSYSRTRRRSCPPHPPRILALGREGTARSRERRGRKSCLEGKKRLRLPLPL